MPSKFEPYRLNTSNPAKLEDFRSLCKPRGILISHTTREDLDEIDATPTQVVVHKASHISHQRTIVEDTSLHVEGANVGVNVRWLTRELKKFYNRRAILLTLLAFREGDAVYVYSGQVSGSLVNPRGKSIPGFEVNPFFLPDGRTLTLAQHVDDKVNPRALALDALASGSTLCVVPPMTSWCRDWQTGGHK